MGWANPSEWLEDVDEFVFSGSVLVLIAFVAALLFAPETVQRGLERAGSLLFVLDGLGHQGVVLLAVGFVLIVLFTPSGSHRLGGPDERPDFGGPTYFAILFSTAIAAGIVFSGPGEALVHFSHVPPGVDAQQETAAAAAAAYQYTLFHWGISVWSIYLAFGIPVAYFVYTHGAPLQFSAILTPFVGPDKLDSYPAKTLDILGVVAPIIGTTTTVARVSQQFTGGIQQRWDIILGQSAVLIFMLGIALVFTVSAVTGIHRGIRRLSIANVAGFVVLGTLVFVLGPTGYILGVSGDAVISYVRAFGAMSTETGTGWVESWTLFYWAWWLSWGPFVGVFVARISRGRTLREMVLYGVGASSAATTAWFLTLGATSIRFVQTGEATILSAQGFAGIQLFAALPGGDGLIFIFLVLIVTFLVTSADSLILSVSYQTVEFGTPSSDLRILWGGLLASLTTVILAVAGADIVASAVAVVGSFVGLALVIGVAGMAYELLSLERLRTAVREQR